MVWRPIRSQPACTAYFLIFRKQTMDTFHCRVSRRHGECLDRSYRLRKSELKHRHMWGLRGRRPPAASSHGSDAPNRRIQARQPPRNPDNERATGTPLPLALSRRTARGAPPPGQPAARRTSWLLRLPLPPPPGASAPICHPGRETRVSLAPDSAPLPSRASAAPRAGPRKLGFSILRPCRGQK